jgi:hypothetical protein
VEDPAHNQRGRLTLSLAESSPRSPDRERPALRATVPTLRQQSSSWSVQQRT